MDLSNSFFYAEDEVAGRVKSEIEEGKKASKSGKQNSVALVR